jgi:hypothetical protein
MPLFTHLRGVGNSANFAQAVFSEVRREPVLPLPGGGRHGIMIPSRLTNGPNVKADWGENAWGEERVGEGSGRAEVERNL